LSLLRKYRTPPAQQLDSIFPRMKQTAYSAFRVSRQTHHGLYRQASRFVDMGRIH
jgi:hypothetical protein